MSLRRCRPWPYPVLLLTLLVVASPALAAGRPGKANRAATATGPRVERSGPILGDELNIVAASRAGLTDPTRASTAVDEALQDATRLEGVFADGGASELARLNRTAAERRFSCSEDLYAALEAASTVAAETRGAYDPTNGPLLRAWDRRVGDRAPEPADLAAARLLVGWRMLTLDPDTRTARFARPGMELAVGAVARGVVLDRLATLLRDRGIARARLELGGDVLAFTAYEAWSAAVPDPSGDDGAVMTLTISNAAAATARTGRDRRARVVDPRTGQSPQGAVSVTVVERSALRARALAEALLVMGRGDAAAYAHDHPEVGVLWLERSGGDVRAWVWNLGRVEPEPGVRVEWMTQP